MALAATAALVVVVGIAATAFSTVTSTETIDKSIIRSGTSGSDAATVTTLDSRSLTSDGGKVNRSRIVGLGGKVVPADKEPVAVAARAPARLQTPKIEDVGEGQVPAGPGQNAASADGSPVASLVVARANIVWARAFRELGVSYLPVRHDSAARWESGPCSDIVQAPGPNYCKNNNTVYLQPKRRVGTLDMLELAHEVGHHVQDMMGVMIKPLSGDAREFQADCFAGLWASREHEIAAGLKPELLEVALADGYQLSLWDRSRLEAFTQGFVARKPTDCSGLSTTWLTEQDR